MPRILFGFIAATLLIGISYITSKMYALGFRFGNTGTKISFLIFLIIPLLFALSIMLTRTTPSIGPTIYSAIQIITGFGLYLFLGALILGVVLLISTLSHTPLPLFVPVGIFVLSIALGAVGLIQSRYITATTYDVVLPHLPPSWENKTAVLVSDTHFGLVNYTKFSDKVVSKISSLHPDIVLHAGDFYDGPFINTAPMTESWKKLASTIPVFYAPGNHEGYGDYQQFVGSVRAAGAHVLEDSMVTYEGMQIAGIVYHDGKNSPEAAESIGSFTLDPLLPSILINHPPTSLAAAEAAGFSLMVSGHTHNGQFWPNNYIARAVYGEQSYGLHAFKTLQTLTTSGVGTFGPPFRTFNAPEIVVIRFKRGK